MTDKLKYDKLGAGINKEASMMTVEQEIEALKKSRSNRIPVLAGFGIMWWLYSAYIGIPLIVLYLIHCKCEDADLKRLETYLEKYNRENRK